MSEDSQDRRYFFRDSVTKAGGWIEQTPLPGLTSHAVRFVKSQIADFKTPPERKAIETRKTRVIRTLEPMSVTGVPFGGRVIAAAGFLAPSPTPLSRAWALFAHRDGALSCIELVRDSARGWIQNLRSTQNRFWVADFQTVTDGATREGAFRYQAAGAPMGEVREMIATPWGSILCASDQFIEVFLESGLIVRRVALATTYPRQVRFHSKKDEPVRVEWINAQGLEFEFKSHQRPCRDALVSGELIVRGAEDLPDFTSEDPKQWLRLRLMPFGGQGIFAASAEHVVPFASGQNYRASLVVSSAEIGAGVGDGVGAAVGSGDASVVSVLEEWF